MMVMQMRIQVMGILILVKQTQEQTMKLKQIHQLVEKQQLKLEKMV